MSYILDALKKAERERGAGRLPWLTKAQSPLEKKRNRTVKIAGGILLGVVAILLSLSPFLADFLRRPKPLPAAPEPLTQPAPATAQSGNGQGTPVGVAPERRSSARSDAAPSSEEAARLPDSTTQTAPNQKRRTTPVTQGESLDVPRTASAPPIEIVLPVPDTNTSNTSAKEAAPPSGATTTGETLAEAVAKMTLNMLMYDEAEADRRVYINGKKYIKGDLVEGKYLIEQITKEGATLSYQGVRLVLRPR